MQALEIALFGLAICFALIFLRMPVAFAFGLTGFIGLWMVKGFEPALAVVGTVPYSTLSGYTFVVIPMFVLMGYLAYYGGLAKEFYEGIRRWIGGVRGGLAWAVILGNTAFGACTGDSVSAACTFAAMSLPEMRKFRYHDRLSIGSIAAGSVLAQLIPPSFAFIIYGILTQTSIGTLFIAGIVPGLLLTGVYLLAITILCIRDPLLGPAGPRVPWREKMRAGVGMWALILIMVVIIGGLYLGWFTPTEAASVGCCVAFALGLLRRQLDWQGIKAALEETGLTACMVFFVVVGCQIFNSFLAVSRAQFFLANWLGGVSQSPVGMLFIIVAIYLLLGSVLDVLSITLLTVPIVFPVVTALGIDPVHFGVIQVLSTTVGVLSPPFGIVIYALGGVLKDVPMSTIFRSVLPFLLAIVAVVVLVVLFPQLSLWLPGTMGK